MSELDVLRLRLESFEDCDVCDEVQERNLGGVGRKSCYGGPYIQGNKTPLFPAFR